MRLRKELRAFQFLVVPSFPACLRTPTGTMTVGGGELSAPEAWACCRGGMVEQYSAGLLGFGLWLLAKTGVSHDRAEEKRTEIVKTSAESSENAHL